MTTTPSTLPDPTAAYAALRERVSELVHTAEEDQLQAIAPATPEWRVHDVVSHMVGVTSDVLAGRMDGVTTDGWTAAQVDPRRDRSTETVIEEWNANAAIFEPMIPDFGPIAGQAVLDASTHEHDIRHALDRPGARDSDAVHIGSAWIGDRIGEFHTQAGHGTLRIETDLWTRTYGEDDPATTLRVSAFELMRASTGRRSRAQIEAWEWTGTPRPELVVMPIFVPLAEPFDS